MELRRRGVRRGDGPGRRRATGAAHQYRPAPRTLDEAMRRMHRTSEHWRQWITLGDFPDHRWRSYLQRSALTLKGLTYAPSGALMAAATTCLPETPHGERNWDYR